MKKDVIEIHVLISLIRSFETHFWDKEAIKTFCMNLTNLETQSGLNNQRIHQNNCMCLTRVKGRGKAEREHDF